MSRLYDDGRISLDEEGLSIRWYYLWGDKRIPYARIRGVERHPMTGLSGKWRIWGSGDFVHWWNLDPGRPGKETALVLDVGHRVRPTISPDDADTVESILRTRVGPPPDRQS